MLFVKKKDDQIIKNIQYFVLLRNPANKQTEPTFTDEDTALSTQGLIG